MFNNTQEFMTLELEPMFFFCDLASINNIPMATAVAVNVPLRLK